MGCVVRDLGVQDPLFPFPTHPVVLFDAVHHRLDVVAYASGVTATVFMQCNVDGTGCTNTRLAPSAGSGNDPSAVLFAGKLIAASMVYSTGAATGVDVSILSTY